MTTNQQPTAAGGSREPVLVTHQDLEVIEAEWGQLTWYASAAQGNSSELTLGRCVLFPNKSNPYHYHPNCDELLTVVAGTIAHTWKSGETIEMNPGDTITIPRGMRHQAKNVGAGNAVLTIVFTSADRKTIGED
jgi:quercetin dioxygenase-like cupin family protein